MSAAPALVEIAADPFALVRVLNKMRAAGFSLSVEGDKLMVEPLSRLSDSQRAYIRSHKPALIGLLSDAETIYSALEQVGTASLSWREGTPLDWSDDRLLAAGEVLYSTRRMVSRNERRYLPERAPPILEPPELEVTP